jgi:hypothetical protein
MKDQKIIVSTKDWSHHYVVYVPTSAFLQPRIGALVIEWFNFCFAIVDSFSLEVTISL